MRHTVITWRVEWKIGEAEIRCFQRNVSHAEMITLFLATPHSTIWYEEWEQDEADPVDCILVHQHALAKRC
jgi:hypothetical protein